MSAIGLPLKVARLRGKAQFDQDDISKSQRNRIRRLIEPIYFIRLKFYLLQTFKMYSIVHTCPSGVHTFASCTKAVCLLRDLPNSSAAAKK